MKLRLVLVASMLGTLSFVATVPAAGAAPAASGRACFRSRDVRSVRAPNSTTLYARVSGRDIYELKLFGSCPDVAWSHRIELRPRGGSRICEGSGLNVEVIPRRTSSASFRTKCQVSGVRRLTLEEASALPANARP